MKIFKTKILTDRQKEEINALWNNEYPAKLKHDFEILSEQRIDSEMIRAVLIRYSSQKNGL